MPEIQSWFTLISEQTVALFYMAFGDRISLNAAEEGGAEVLLAFSKGST